MIVLHRRGTTGEWLQADLVAAQMLADTPNTIPDIILKNGEFAIEERDDGSRYVKIGDGHTKFAALPYIDKRAETLAEKLVKEAKVALQDSLLKVESTLAEMDSGKVKPLKAEIASIKTSCTEGISEVKQQIDNISADLSEQSEATAVQFSSLQHEVKDISSVINKELVPDINDIAVKLANEVKVRAAQDKNNFDRMSELVLTKASDILSHVNSSDAALNETIKANDERISNTLSNTIKQLDNLHDCIQQLNDADIDLTTRLHKVNNTLTSVTNQLSNELSVLQSKHSIDYTSLASSIIAEEEARLDADSKIISAVIDYVTKIYAEIADLVDDDILILEKAYSVENKLSAKIKAIEESLTTEFAVVEQMIFESIEKLRSELKETLAKPLATLTETVEVLRTDTELKFNEHYEALNTLNIELQDADKALDTKIAAACDTIETNKAAINNNTSAIAALDDKLVAYSTTFNNELEAMTSSTEQQFAEQHETIAALEATIQTDISNKISDVELLIEANKNNISSATESINELDREFAASLKEIVENIAAVNAEVTTLHDESQEIHASIQAETQAAIQAISATVETNKIEVNDVIDSLNEQLSRTNEQLTTASEQILIAVEQVSDVNSRIDSAEAAIELQAERIDNLVSYTPDGSIKDFELVDIRTDHTGYTHESAGAAVRNISKELSELGDSLSQYIGTQAVTGLHYDIQGDVGLKQPYMLYLKAGEELLQDSGVRVVGGGTGGGTTSSLAIRYITLSPLVVTPADKAILRFTFSGTDSSGDIIKQANATWKINGLTVEHGTVKFGDNEFDATKYISAGTTEVFLTVTDANGSTVTKSWDVQLIELTIASTFNDRLKYPANEALIFDYIPTGAVEKTVVFKLDGQELDRVILGKEVSGSHVSYELPPQEHGSHLLEVYLEAEINDEIIPSNHILKDILWYDTSSSTPVISTTPHSLIAKQYSTTNIIYTVYDPLNENPVVTVMVDDVVVATPTVTPNKDYSNTPTAIYSYNTASTGAHIIKIICGETEKLINIFVEDVGVNISPVASGLAFDFNPAGRSNGDENRLWSHGDVHLSVSDNFDWINGGYIQNDPDGPCFCIKAGSSATIDYKLFANEAKVYGKEFKLIFKTKNVSNPDAIFLSCLDNTTAKDHIGLSMGVHSASIFGKSGNLELAYSEEDAIEFEFNISKDTEAVPVVMGYEDGVPSRPMVYDSTFSFKQNTPKVISLGSNDCDLYIYRLKVYNTSLSNTDILKNFIADARTAEEMISRYTRNQIYDENQTLTAESVAASCPWLRVYKVSAPHFTNNKSDKVSDTTIQQIHLSGDPVLDNWVAYNAQHSGQGTSSNNYGAAGRNLDFIMNKSSSYFELGDGSTTDKITLTRESVPVAYLNAKVNIASSNNLTNAILANRYNKFNPYRRPFVREEGVNTDFIKDTMEFYNCVIFIQETDPDLSTHREFADNDWHFYAIGNIGDSKKTDDTRLTDQTDPYECCVEIMDVDLPLSAFPRDTMIDAMSYDIDEATEERVYTWAKDSNLGILYEKLEDGSYVLTSDTTVDFNKTYYVDILLHDDFSEDYTYGWRYISDDEDQEVVDFCKQRWIEFYRFVTTSSNEEFKANLKDYFVIDSALFYYLFTTRYCMVDNRAKNTFWHYSKTADGTRKWDLCWDYDNDTSLGLNNYGKQLYRYGLEDVDFDSSGTEVFRQSDSLFFCRIRDLFGAELKKMYQDLESKDAWKASTLIKECDDWQSQFPEELWRVDIERKYIRTYTKSFINGGGDKQFLTNMSNGKMKYHRRNWERNQEAYMASKYQTTTAMSESAHANFRVNRFDSTDELVIKPSYQFTLTPYSYMYLNVYYNSGSPISVRAEPNVPTVVPYLGTNADIINVGSAASIKDFGDLSALYPDTVSVQNASRARTLKIGNNTEGYRNNGFSEFTTGANNLLEELDLTNTSYSKSLNLSALINLKKVLAFGTDIPGVIFAEGGKMQYAELPALSNLDLRNLQYLSTDNLKLTSYDYIVDLTIIGCQLIDQLAMLEACANVRRVKLDNINFGTRTYEYFEEKIFNLSGTDADAANAQITGFVHFETLTGAQFNELRARYPHLTITYDLLTSIITFKDTDTETTTYEQTILNAGDCEDPTTVVGWLTPSMPPEQEFRYEWFGWSVNKNVILNYEHMDESTVAETKQADYTKYRVDSIKRVEGDRTLYPVFEAIRQQYEVQFINPTDNNRVMYSVMVPYGYDTAYIGDVPQKLDSVSPEIYEFIGWYPIPEKIIDTLHCYAQFAVKDQDRLPGGEDDGDTLPGYTIGWLDISKYVDNQGNERVGYTLDTSKETMAITKCNNNLNVAIRIPESLELDGINYLITSLGGFIGNDRLELIYFADTAKIKTLTTQAFSGCVNLLELILPADLTTIGDRAFENCKKLAEINIPAKVTSIADRAFIGCSLESITVAEENTVYEVVNDCLLSGKGLSSNKKLVKGLSTGSIPNDGSIAELRPYCFAETGITEILIPDSITKISSNAFRLCTALTTVHLPSNLIELDASCFARCEKLANITLPDTVTDIKTYAFVGCAIEDIAIPSAVNNILDNAFGSQTKLAEVTFAKKYDKNGNIAVPHIHKQAFQGSGVSTGIVFNVPWSKDFDYNYTELSKDSDGKEVITTIDPTGWGAKKWTIYYSDGWRNSDGESGIYETI